jgi:hypothetical protein
MDTPEQPLACCYSSVSPGTARPWGGFFLQNIIEIFLRVQELNGD